MCYKNCVLTWHHFLLNKFGLLFSLWRHPPTQTLQLRHQPGSHTFITEKQQRGKNCVEFSFLTCSSDFTCLNSETLFFSVKKKKLQVHKELGFSLRQRSSELLRKRARPRANKEAGNSLERAQCECCMLNFTSNINLRLAFIYKLNKHT